MLDASKTQLYIDDIVMSGWQWVYSVDIMQISFIM